MMVPMGRELPLLPTNELHTDRIKRTHTLSLSYTHSLSLSLSLSLVLSLSDTRTHTPVKPPRLGGAKKGVFATRAPHRRNPIGLPLCRSIFFVDRNSVGFSIFFLGYTVTIL